MKKLILILLPFISSVAQAKLSGKACLDSLVSQLETRFSKTDDTNKVKLLNSICYLERSLDPDAGIRYGNKQLQVAEKIGWRRGIALSYQSLAINYEVKSDIPASIEYNLKSLKIN